MWIGPIHPVLPGTALGHNPVKPIKVTTNVGHQAVLFDQSYPVLLQPDPVEIQVDTVVYEVTAALALTRITQIAEIAQNPDWQRAGLFIQWREDGVTDPQDGWYVIKSADVSEDYLFSAYAEPRLDFELRIRQRTDIGTYVDAKAQLNDVNAGGVALAAYPIGVTPGFPAVTYQLPGVNGNVAVVENPTSVMRGQLTTPLSVMQYGRCMVTDES